MSMDENAKQEEYLGHARKSECPLCGSENGTWDGIEVDAGTCFQPAHCMDCEASWAEVYRLDHITIIDYGKMDTP